MEKYLRHIERLFYRVFLILAVLISLLIIGGYWLFKTDMGQTYLTHKVLQNVNSKMPYQILYESITSNKGRITITDLHLDSPDNERLISLDSLRTGVLLSSIFKSTITIPELTVFDLQVEKTINQKFIDSFSNKASADTLTKSSDGLINSYLSQLNWNFSQLNLKLDSLNIDLNDRAVFLKQLYVDFDFVQFSTKDFYAVMDSLKVESVINDKTHSIKAKGILYRDQRDFAFSNMRVNYDESSLHFNLDAIDVFSDVQRGLRQARFIGFELFDDSYINVKNLFPQIDNIKGLEEINLGLNIKILPKDGIAEVSSFKLFNPNLSVTAAANLNIPSFKISDYNWNRLSGDIDLDAIISPSLQNLIPEKINYNRSYISDDVKIKLKNSLYANELRQEGFLVIQNDTLIVNHDLLLSVNNNLKQQNLTISANFFKIGSLLFNNESIRFEKPIFSTSLSYENNSIKNIVASLNVEAIDQFKLKRTKLTIDGDLEKSVFFLNTKISDGEITSYGDLYTDNKIKSVLIKTNFDNVSLFDVTASKITAKEPLFGNINVAYNVDEANVFNLNSSVSDKSKTDQSHNLNFEIIKLDSLNYATLFKSPFLDAEIKSTNFRRAISEFRNFDKNQFINLLKAKDTVTVSNTSLLTSLPEFQLKTKAHFKPTDVLSLFFRDPVPDYMNISLDSDFITTKKYMKAQLAINSDSVSYQKLKWNNLSSLLSFEFSETGNNNTLSKDINFDLDIDKLSFFDIPVEGVAYNAQLNNNQIYFSQKTDNFIQNARFDYTINGEISEEGLAVNLTDFLFGNENYGWKTVDTVDVVWDDYDHALIQNLILENGNERIEIAGNLGRKVTDLLNYRLLNIDLEKLSTLLQSRMPFAGFVNGSFTLSSNTQTPFFDGKLSVDSLTLRDRTLGDLVINSTLDSLSGKFLADLSLKTDSISYPNLATQNIYGSGFFDPKRDPNAQDTLAYLSIEFEDLAMWFLPSVATNVFDSTSGRATGYGSFISTGSDFDYNAFFSVDSVYANPRFINTDYFLSGPIYFTRSQGVIIDSVIVEDQYGSAKLWGNVDLNDFQEEKFMNLSMRLNGLQFMNNIYDPDVPFYGNVRGNGTVTLKGSSFNPTIATPDPIRISPGSELKLPLLDETDFEADRSYIRFTDDFSTKGLSAQELLNRDKIVEQKAATIFSRNNEEIERKFIDVFNLELLFSAPEETTIELIFDDVTNEILRANGSGDIRVGLSDKELLINGTYTLSSGSYNFVSADFFNRRFSLQDGGTIRWDGDPTNAQIDVSAVYTQRADFSSFLGQNSGADNNTTFRYPIDMVLDITGRLQSIENDYQFRLGQNMEFATNLDIINNVIASVNTEQYKLYQATSFLLTNSFLPVENGAAGGLADANRNVISNIQQNPDALIAPLLSGQINNLLNTNLGTVFQNLEIDLNLSTLDQIDLGLALRLFQDRLTIRRNRSVATAPNENTIGDIDANYKLNNSWSVLMFHRQDPLFSDVSGVNNQQTTNTQALNGVGLEWQQQFNSWRDLTASVKRAWRRLFGLKEPIIELEEDAADQSITQKN